MLDFGGPIGFPAFSRISLNFFSCLGLLQVSIWEIKQSFQNMLIPQDLIINKEQHQRTLFL